MPKQHLLYFLPLLHGKARSLVKVHAAAVTPTELQWFPTFNTKEGEARSFPIVPGHEFSGVVAAAGNGTRGFKPGDVVYGMNDWFTNGALAEYCVAPAAAIAIKPGTLVHPQSAVVPISTLTAWQGLFECGKFQAGERVWIHGATGGVGVFAVQLPRWREEHVAAIASAHNLDFIRELGAQEVIDYKTVRFEEVVRDVDVVFDSIGGETLECAWGVLRARGRLVTIAAQSESIQDQRARDAFFIVEPQCTQLTEIARLLDAGMPRPFVEAVYLFDQARESYAHALRGRMRGKVVLQFAS